jgi:hypothetical protein
VKADFLRAPLESPLRGTNKETEYQSYEAKEASNFHLLCTFVSSIATADPSLEKPRKPRKKSPPSRTPPTPSRSPSKSPTPPDPPEPEPEPTQSVYPPNSIPPSTFNSTEYTPRYLPSDPSGISSLDTTTDSVPLSPQPQVSGYHNYGSVWLLTGLQLYSVEINGTWTSSAVFDPGSEDSFVSDIFVQSLTNIKSKRASKRKIWHDSFRNEYHAYFGFKASIRVGERGKILKDQTLYILSGEMSQSVILGNKIRSNLSSKGSIDWAPSPKQNPINTNSHHKTMSLPVRSIRGTAEPSADVPLYSSETSYTPGDATSTESTQLQPAFSPLTGINSSQTDYASFSSYTPPHKSYQHSDYTTSVEGNSSFDSSNYDQGTATPGVAWTEEIPDSGSGNYVVGSGSMSSYPSSQPRDLTPSWPTTPPYTENSGQSYYQPPQYKYQEL